MDEDRAKISDVFYTGRDGLIEANRAIGILDNQINNYISEKLIISKCKPYAAENIVMITAKVVQETLIRPDYLTMNKASKMIDEAESVDEPDQPVKDQWCSSFICVERITKITNDGDNNLAVQDMSPRSHRSSRSYARSSIIKDRPTRLKTDKSLNLSNPIKLRIEEEAVPTNEQRLRERKHKQIQHQKWEEAEKKRIQEEERLEKLKNRFALINTNK